MALKNRDKSIVTGDSGDFETISMKNRNPSITCGGTVQVAAGDPGDFAFPQPAGAGYPPTGYALFFALQAERREKLLFCSLTKTGIAGGR